MALADSIGRVAIRTRLFPARSAVATRDVAIADQ
jgi:hypothetical protein